MAESKTVALAQGEWKTIALLVENAARLFPGSERVKALSTKKAELDKRNEEVDKSILENRTMRPDHYKGQGQAETEKIDDHTMKRIGRGLFFTGDDLLSR
jgi:hypothetical protein